jgi:hypothetical protein
VTALLRVIVDYFTNEALLKADGANMQQKIVVLAGTSPALLSFSVVAKAKA